MVLKLSTVGRQQAVATVKAKLRKSDVKKPSFQSLIDGHDYKFAVMPGCDGKDNYADGDNEGLSSWQSLVNGRNRC